MLSGGLCVFKRKTANTLQFYMNERNLIPVVNNSVVVNISELLHLECV